MPAYAVTTHGLKTPLRASEKKFELAAICLDRRIGVWLNIPMTESSNRPTADSIAAAEAHDRYLAELRAMPPVWYPPTVKRSTPSRGPRRQARKIIR